MRFVSWNVNGLRACMQKGFMDFFTSVNADFFCLQETKLQAGQIALDLPGYEQYWNYAEKKGYSGTAIFTKHTPLSVSYGMGIPELDTEGRLITLEYPEFYLVTCYTPNAQRGLARLDHRLKWETAFRDYLTALDTKKPVVLCGDLNVAHNEIDLKNPNSNRGNAGFSDEERAAFSKLLECGFTDTFRHLHPDTAGAYTWWSYMFNARQNNAGWRIDYFVVSERIKEHIFSTPIYSNILGSDHCPVGLDLNVPCNGGIWPSFENTEVVTKQEETTETKSSGVKAAAALLCVALFLTGIYFSMPQNHTQPPATDTLPTDTPATTAPVIRPPGDTLIRWNVARNKMRYRSSASPLSSILVIDAFIDGTKEYPVDTKSVFANFNFWVRIDAIDAKKLQNCDLKAFVLYGEHLNSNFFESSPNCYITKYRDESGAFAGWFVYGRIQWDSHIQVELYDDSGVLQNATIPVTPIMSTQDTFTKTTQSLVEYALHLEAIKTVIAIENEDIRLQACMALLQHHPALVELVFRDNATIKLAEHVSLYPSCADAAEVLTLLINDIRDRYIGYKDTTAVSDMETDALIIHLSNQPQLTDCVSDLITEFANNSIIYHVLHSLQPAVAELTLRADTASSLLRRYGQSPIISVLLSLPEFMSKFSVNEATNYIHLLAEENGIETVSTKNLAMVISSLSLMNTTLQFSYPYSYDNLRQIFPALQELENREDAHTVLLTYLIDYRGIVPEDQKTTASLLLHQEPFYSRLDGQQLKILEMGGLIVYGDFSTLPIGSPVIEP